MSRAVSWILTAAGLALLVAATLVPVWLIIRQAVTPRHLSGQFPASFLPPAVTLEAVRELLKTQQLIQPFLRSVLVAAVSTGLSVALALPAGWALARARWFGAAGVQGSLIARVLPPIAISLPLAAWLIRLGLANRPSGIGLAFAHTSAVLPLAILVCTAACRALPLSLEEAAEIDGAGRLAVLLHVVLPLTRGAVGAAALLGFLYSWDDFTHALVIQVTYPTLPPKIAYVAQYGELSQASALALVMLVPAAAVMAVLSKTIVSSGALGRIEK
jgi:multiple sugar transport system permease protein